MDANNAIRYVYLPLAWFLGGWGQKNLEISSTILGTSPQKNPESLLKITYSYHIPSNEELNEFVNPKASTLKNHLEI